MKRPEGPPNRRVKMGLGGHDSPSARLLTTRQTVCVVLGVFVVPTVTWLLERFL